MVRVTGTNDVVSWKAYGTSIAHVGLFETYRQIALFNHPPLMGLWALAATDLGGADGRWFPAIFKLVAVCGDLLGAWLLYRHGNSRPGRGPEAGLMLACLFLWNPVSFLVTSYHGNTDPLLASLCLWAALLAQANNPVGAGLALGAAFNVKIVALILLLPLAVSVRSWRGLLRFGGAFAVTCLPFVPPLVIVGQPFIEHVLKYNSTPGSWGLGLFFRDIQAVKHLGPHFVHANETFFRAARFIVLGSVAALAVVMRARGGRRWLEVAAFGFSTALVFAPGFGYQYLAWPLPLFFAIDAERAMANAVVGGALSGLMYLHAWDGKYPGLSQMDSWPRIAIILGALTWGTLVAFSFRLGKAALRDRGMGDA